jgi:hypothetical protein
MTREDFRRELGDAFDSISGSPDPALSDRVRAALVEAPEHRGPVWIGALAAAVIAVILVGVLLVGNPLNRQPSLGGPGQSPSPNPTPSPQYICGASSAFTGQNPPLSLVIADVRTGTHTGYDRLTVEFKDGQPASIEIRPQANTNFITDPKGDTVKLAGQVGLKVVIHSADVHGAGAYTGPADIKTGYAGLAEVRQLGDFEGYATYGLGLGRPGCYAAVILTNPTRLVIDIQVS